MRLTKQVSNTVKIGSKYAKKRQPQKWQASLFLNGESFPRPSYAFLWSRNEALFLLILFLPPTDLKLSDDNSCAFFPDTVRH